MQSFNEFEPVNDGVDRKQLANIKRDFLTVNQEKYNRTLAFISARQQDFVKLIPLFFHVNHPMLPGYISHKTPAGVSGYVPSKDDMQIVKNISRSFKNTRDLLDKNYAIDAIFMMGSIGSIAQSEASDIDVWVCCDIDIEESGLAELDEKCNKLTRWAADVIHIEINFFLMNANKFSHGQHVKLTGDASGSAQHFLLLDEFYRTAVWLAGKVPLWWFVPAGEEIHYREYSSNLIEKRFLRETDVIDFGGVPEIPTNEFIGAGVWQLYKGIAAPYKSILKLLLLEVYADNKFNEPLSLELKRKIYAVSSRVHSVIDANEFDPYILVYQRLEKYLTAKNQLARLELVRRCLYFKANFKVAKEKPNVTSSWKKSLIENLVMGWNWTYPQLTLLNARSQWKSSQVLVERTLLANELNESYHLLVELNKNHPERSAITGNELLILGRKLHAAFEVKSGKIDWINPNISNDISESSLCFVQTIEDGVPLWKVYPASQQDVELRMQKVTPIKRTRNFIEALMWCYGNEILSSGTKVDILSKRFTLQLPQLQQLQQAIHQWLPLPLTKPTHEAFTQNSQTNRILLLLNVGIEPQSELLKKGKQMLSGQGDAFVYSGFKENLVISADMIQSNNWGEVICRHFENDGLIKALLHYLTLYSPFKQQTLPALTIRCLSLGLGGIIEQRVSALWRSITICFYVGDRANNKRFVFEMESEYFVLQFVQRQPQIARFKTYEKLLEKLSSPQVEYSSIVLDKFALQEKSLRFICNVITKPEVYIFYKLEGKKNENQVVHVYVMDHKGSLFSASHRLFDIKMFLDAFCGFIRSAVAHQISSHDFCSDTSMSIESLQRINIYEITGEEKQRNICLEPRHIDHNLDRADYFNVRAVAENRNNNKLGFTLYCEDIEFSESAFGENVFAEVAQYIFNRRKSGETYPYYITDLDLSPCHDEIAPHTGIQLVHYLKIKNELEKRLNSAF